MVAKMTMSFTMTEWTNLAAKAPPASPRSWVNSCWMASFQASAATSPRANVINSANLSKTRALNFYSSFLTWASLTSVGLRALCRQTRLYTLNQLGQWRNSETSLRLMGAKSYQSVRRSLCSRAEQLRQPYQKSRDKKRD